MRMYISATMGPEKGLGITALESPENIFFYELEGLLVVISKLFTNAFQFEYSKYLHNNLHTT